MTTKQQRERLIPEDDIERVFDDEAIARIASVAKLPPETDLKWLSHSIRDAVKAYLADAHVMQPGEIRATITGLARSVKKALEGKPGALEEVVTNLDALSPGTRKTFEKICHPKSVPNAADLLDPVKGPGALSMLYGLLHVGAEWKLGRKRGDGKQSQARLVGIVRAPPVSSGRPPSRAEFMLCTRLRVTYFKATGKKPPKRADSRNPGPFVRLLLEVLRLAGATGVDPVGLVEEVGRVHRKRNG